MKSRLWRALFERSPEVSSDRARLGVEALDDRITPAAPAGFDAVMQTARLEAPTLIRFSFYENDPLVLPVGVYRSADPIFDAGDELVGGGLITPPPGGGFGVGSAGLVSQLTLDPSRDFVLVVADPFQQVAEFDESNNVAAFRKIAVAAVTHGFSVTGNPIEWLAPFAAQVQAEGYDFAFPFVWTPLSQIPTPDGTTIAGQTLAQMVRFVGTALAGPNDVVDVHLIGHSRGTSVVSQAFQSLTLNPGPRAVALGYFKQTLLDLHVARNFAPAPFGVMEVLLASGTVGTSQVAQLSFDPSREFSRGFALAVIGFQAAAMDPPAFVPLAVDEAESYFQRLAWNETTFVIPGLPTTAEKIIGVNFLGLPTVPNPFGRALRNIDLGPEGVGHYEVPDWYLANVVPTLGG